MSLGYPRNDMVLGFQGHGLGLGLRQQQYRFELYECPLVATVPLLSRMGKAFICVCLFVHSVESNWLKLQSPNLPQR